MNVALDKVVAALDAEMRLKDFTDSSHNGLQVANRRGRVTRVCCGVDASLPFFEQAAAQEADLLICHHGLSWGDSLARLTGLAFRQVSFLIDHGMALYGCHLPLDAHPTLGNNARICRALGLTKRRPFGDYHGQFIGFSGCLPHPLRRDAFAALLRRKLAPRLQVMPFGPAVIRSVGVVSGGAADLVDQAATAGLDAYVSGEATLQGFNLAQQHGVNAFFAGHYATERFGVEAVGAWLVRRFKLPGGFVDLDIPY